MGLIAYRERAPDDKSPYRRNEFHVGKQHRCGASKKQSTTADASTLAAVARSPIRRRYDRPTTTQRRRAFLSEMISAAANSDAVRLDTQEQLTRIHNQYEERVRHEQRHAREEVSADPDSRVRDSITSNFAPAHQYYDQLRNRHTSSDDRAARVGTSRTASPEFLSPGRVASPATEQAILRELENPEDRENEYRLFVDGAAHDTTTVPRMRISRSDGLGDRRRSLSPRETSHEDSEENWSSLEENWNSLMRTIPPQDENLPSAGSSFASDSASSILSRSRPHSSLTNTTADSRAASAEATHTADSATNCPEIDSPSRLRPRGSTLAPVRYSSSYDNAPRTNRDGVTAESLVLAAVSDRRVDDLLDMFDNGVDIPAETWAAIGVSSHLGLRREAARLSRRRNERL